MKSSVSIKPAKALLIADEIEESRQGVAVALSNVERVMTDTTVKGTDIYLIKRHLKKATDGLQAEENAIDLIGKKLIGIVEEYVKTEQEIVEAGALLEKADFGNTPDSQNGEKGDSFWDDFTSTFRDNFWDDLRDAVITGSGVFVERLSGVINDITAVGRGDGFILVNPAVSEQTLLMSKIGRSIVTGAKYGLPIIGGVIDFIAQKKDGEETVHAGIKAVAHTGIGIAGAEAGAAIGAAVGSVVPVAGTAVGAVVGFCIGVAISTVGDVVFDHLYDNYIRGHVDNLTGAVKSYSLGSSVLSPVASII